LADTKTFQVPADEPGVALVRLVRKMGLPYSGRLVSSAVAAHAQPQSLLALVQVAPTVGLRITAARVEPEGLDELQMPAVVHFAKGQGGFGVLERVSGDAVEIWDGRNGRRRVPKDVFLANWSGIVALAERDDSQRRAEPDYRRRRLVEMLAGTPSRPDLAGSREAPVLAGITAFLLGLLVLAALVDHPAGTRVAALVVAALAAAGLGVSATLTTATAGQATNVNVPGCPRGKLVNCESVLNSDLSKVRGIPTSDLGTSFFGAVLLLIATAAVAPATVAVWAAISIAYVAAVPAALLLIGAQVVMRRFCTLCLAVHALVLGGAAAAWPFLRESWDLSDVAPALGLALVYASLILFLAIPFFTRAERTRQLIETQQRVATSPFSTLAHLTTEPPSPVRGGECGIKLPGPPARHELVLFAHPTCNQCAQTIEELSDLAAAGATEAFVAILPRYPDGPEREVCEAVLAAGGAYGPGALLHAYFFAKKGFGALMEGDPVALLAEEMRVPREVLDRQLAGARELMARTEEYAEGRIDGTPALFFDSRLYQYGAPVAHLATLLDKHSDLLPPATGAAEGAREVTSA
jgi:uncharacterized membrane protein